MWSPVMDCAPTQRPVAKLSFLLINVFLLLAPRTASTQQLSGTFPVEERQTAVVRVVPGEFVRARLADGSRAGGPLVGATPVAFTLGPSVAYSANPSVVRLVTVDSLWVRAYSSRRGAVIGGGLGGLLGLGLEWVSTPDRCVPRRAGPEHAPRVPSLPRRSEYSSEA